MKTLPTDTTKETTTRALYRCQVCKAVERVSYRTVKTVRWWLATTPTGGERPKADTKVTYFMPDGREVMLGGRLPERLHCKSPYAKNDYPPPMRVKVIEGFVRQDVVCNAKCMAATGPSCECSCGGEHHGGKYDTYTVREIS